MQELLDLKQDQYMVIEKVKYRVLNKVKFTEKSSYWVEYKLQNLEEGQMYYLNVEASLMVILYQVVQEKKIPIKIKMTFGQENYELFEKGSGKVETYYGLTNVGLKDTIQYYEYKNQEGSKILSIEVQKDKTEVSLGRKINLSHIKILKEFN